MVHDDGYFDERVAATFDEDYAYQSDPVVGIEVLVPGLQRLPPTETFQVFEAEEAHWGIDEYDVAKQGLISHHFRRVEGQIELRSVPFRYVWPAELDLMADLAGMDLRHRWAGWNRETFTSDSRGHVSAWQKRDR